MHYMSLLNSVWTKIQDIVLGILAIIPQTMYFLYASAASLLDACQMLLRKLAGLDVYYVKDAASGAMSERTGDLLAEFIEGILGINQKYSALNTVFWSLIIFGVMLLVLSTIFAIIKAHYNYDSSKSQPTKIIGQSLKSLALMAITPVMVLFGVYLNEVTLKALDNITSPDPAMTISEYYEADAIQNFKAGSRSSDGNSGKAYYSSFDMFGVAEYTNTNTFSGLLFRFVAYDSNRVRMGSYEALQTASNNKWDSCEVFYSTLDDGEARKEKVALQIDYAFANCLQLQSARSIDINKEESASAMVTSLSYGPSAAFAARLVYVNKFSKFNVGLVWYYYNLWTFNFLIAYLGVGLFLLLLSNIMFGLMKRIIICVALFLVNAPVIGLSPLDGGSAFTTWRKSFIGYIISAYGTVIGMNIFFLLLPVIENISFFNVAILDRLFDLIVVAAAFAMIKKFTSLLSSFISATDAGDEGEKTKKDVGGLATGAMQKTMATAKLGVKVGAYAMTGGLMGGAIRGVRASVMVRNGTATDRKDALSKLKDKSIPSRIGGLVAKIKAKPAGGGAFKRFAGSKFGQMLMAYTGLSDEKVDLRDEVEELDKDGKPVIDPATGKTKMITDRKKTNEARGERRLAGVGARRADISGMIFKGFGQITGIANVQSSLVKSGLIDDGKEVIQDSLGALGMKFDPEKNSKSKLLTKKQSDDAKKKKEDNRRQAMSDSAFQSKEAAAEVFRAIEAVKKKGTP